MQRELRVHTTLEESMKVTKGTEDAEEEGREGIFFFSSRITCQSTTTNFFLYILLKVS